MHAVAFGGGQHFQQRACLIEPPATGRNGNTIHKDIEAAEHCDANPLWRHALSVSICHRLAQRHRVAHGCAFHGDYTVIPRHAGAQLADRLVCAHIRDLHATRDGVARSYGRSEGPIHIEKDRSRPGKLLSGDGIEDGTCYATLDDDLSEAGGFRGLEVVVERVAISTDSVKRAMSLSVTVRDISAVAPTTGAPSGQAVSIWRSQPMRSTQSQAPRCDPRPAPAAAQLPGSGLQSTHRESSAPSGHLCRA